MRLPDRPFERAMALWGRDAFVLAQLPPPPPRQAAPLAPPPQSRFLDVGCGSGLLAIAAAAMGYDVTALDLSALEIGRLNAKIAAAVPASPTAGITTLVGDGQTLTGVADASITVVGSVFGIFMFPDRVAAWTSVHRVLIPRGRLVATSWDATTVNARLFQYVLAHAVDRTDLEATAFDAATQQTTPTPTPAPNRTLQAASFRAELEECGFVNVHVHTVSHPITFVSGEELLDDLLASEWVRSVVARKHEASVKRVALDFVQLVLDGNDPFDKDGTSQIRVASDVPAERHPLWTQPFALQALGHIAVATKP